MRRLKKLLPQVVPEVRTFFSSGSIIDSVLNFGLAAPIDVQFTGADLPRAVPGGARGRRDACAAARGVADTFIPQESDYPTLQVKVDRVKAARLGLNQNDVVSNVITALTSNQMIAPSIWIDPQDRQRLLSDRAVFRTGHQLARDADEYPGRDRAPPSTRARCAAAAQRRLHRARAPSRRSRPLQHPARGRRAGRAAHPGPGRHAARRRSRRSSTSSCPRT